MKIRNILLAAAAALTFIGSAQAAEVAPMRGHAIDLGDLSGTAYYTVENGAFHVVATIAREGEHTLPIRFETTLAPGQSVVLSTPHELGYAADAVEIVRLNDAVIMHKSPATN
ncbi:hypothetical protein [Methylocella silvestris]|uniref:Uncharacterized protein n=1 Tax=Methylocella silvestris TaxID=199596 RepID=A0A2J7TBV5_METSI|nr:hypothetical protein [Methylocella silvestris]PNG24250.1 hypothetical protein CR492_19725 [Methylocella silvestris]